MTNRYEKNLTLDLAGIILASKKREGELYEVSTLKGAPQRPVAENMNDRDGAVVSGDTTVRGVSGHYAGRAIDRKGDQGGA